jgi:hypothetical protein
MTQSIRRIGARAHLVAVVPAVEVSVQADTDARAWRRASVRDLGAATGDPRAELGVAQSRSSRAIADERAPSDVQISGIARAGTPLGDQIALTRIGALPANRMASSNNPVQIRITLVMSHLHRIAGRGA